MINSNLKKTLRALYLELCPTLEDQYYLQGFLHLGNHEHRMNNGVRVNIAPLQKIGLLTADVFDAKDLDKTISDRTVWQADERRWCREGKLPKPGWWK